MTLHNSPIAWLGAALMLAAAATCVAKDPAGADEDRTIAIADGKLHLKAPAAWVRKQPASAIVEHEFTVPTSEGDSGTGRVTVMGAGGGVEANTDRWFGQFSQPDGGSTKQRAKTKKLKVAGQDVHLVDVSGTFKDQRGPFAPAVERKKYRMLAAIIESPGQGSTFIKFTGPERTVADHEKAFVEMIEGMQAK